MARVAVLMSGGVDSSGAALAVKEMGHEVMGVTAKMWAPASRCCSEDDIYRAQRVCHKLGIRHVVLDVRQDFDRHVVSPFIRSYLSGMTPNPCASCNREIKLGRIVSMAMRFGFDRVATGHYAAVGEIDGRPVLCEPADKRKSQVYFLSLVRPEVLGMLEFPLQDKRKQEVMEMIRKLELPAREGESQDLCFVPAGRYRELLVKHSPVAGDGKVLDTSGTVVGRHSGHYAYTVGQRFGLHGKRYYVIEKYAQSNEIIIGEKSEAFRQKITITGINAFLPLEVLKQRKLAIKYRYNSPPIQARIIDQSDNRLTFLADEPCFAPAPGQVAACYLEDSVVCAGIIESTG